MGGKNSGPRPRMGTGMKLLRGNPGKRPINLLEPEAPAGEVVMPGELSAGGRVVWSRLAPIAIAMRTLTPADVPAFAALCELQASLDAVYREKGAPGFAPLVLAEDGESVKVHAALRLELAYSQGIRPYYEKFGFDPAGRSRLSVKPAEVTVSKWAGLPGA